MIHFRNNKPAFTLLEVLMALAVFAILITPLFITQGTVVKNVASNTRLVQRIFLAENMLIDARAQDSQAQTFTFDKKIIAPETQLNYSRNPVEKKSVFQIYNGLVTEKVSMSWSDMGQKREDSIVTFLYKPERKKQ
jgi:prepilin-type N-terminal cleavage/methylation domain-containing protein